MQSFSNVGCVLTAKKIDQIVITFIRFNERLLFRHNLRHLEFFDLVSSRDIEDHWLVHLWVIERTIKVVVHCHQVHVLLLRRLVVLLLKVGHADVLPVEGFLTFFAAFVTSKDLLLEHL